MKAINYQSRDMAIVKIFANRQMDGQTKNYMLQSFDMGA
jgi:hypothetical protein